MATRKEEVTSEELLDGLADQMAPRLEERGFVRVARSARRPTTGGYDEATCVKFLDPNHIGNSVLLRAELFFGELDKKGEIGSLDLTALLGLSTPRNIPANLTIALKKSAARLGLEQPWRGDASADGRTIWRDYDGIAAAMVKAIADERQRRSI